MNPQLKIKYNRFLSPIFVGYIKAQSQWKDWKEPSLEEIQEKVSLFKGAWKGKEDHILNEMRKFLGLSFKRNVIDVHVVAGNPRPFSNPIVIKSGYLVDEFILSLTHELIHVLQNDNRVDHISYWKEKIKDESTLTLNHIFVYAVLSHIFPNDVPKMKSASSKHSTDEYSRAWNIVDEIGYKKIGEIARSLSIS